MDFCGHYKNKVYLENKETGAKQKLKNLAYHGDRTIFNIEKYYRRLTDDFTDLAQTGLSHKINEHQKVLKFENYL